MLPAQMINDWARKLIASETATEPTTAPTEPAAIRVYERLRLQFRAPVGVDAFQALASRALSVAKSEFPILSGVNVTANGGLRGLDTVEAPLNLGEDSEIGILLITQMLRLFLTLLGEAATVRLIEDVPPRVEARAELDTTETSISTADTSYLGPFRDISSEADQLRQVSERLETLAETHDDVHELISVAGNIRNVAAVLDVFAVIRSRAGGLRESVLPPPAKGYVN